MSLKYHPLFQLIECTATYISGFITKKLLQKVNCNICKQHILYRTASYDTDFIEARTYKDSKMTTPGDFLNFLISQSVSRLFYLIPRLCHYKRISILLKNILSKQGKSYKQRKRWKICNIFKVKTKFDVSRSS